MSPISPASLSQFLWPILRELKDEEQGRRRGGLHPDLPSRTPSPSPQRPADVWSNSPGVARRAPDNSKDADPYPDKPMAEVSAPGPVSEGDRAEGSSKLAVFLRPSGPGVTRPGGTSTRLSTPLGLLTHTVPAVGHPGGDTSWGPP